ncbi:MAG: hypothetical protein MRY32_01775 [Rickettsiales bacterium]|nr:hypothetical protein [Rickettsiales bacterium]
MSAARLISLMVVIATGYILGFTLYPGLVAPDTVFQYVQMIGGQISNLHPPMMLYLWDVVHDFEGGQAGLFIFNWVVYTLAVWLIVSASSYYLIPRIFYTALLFAPPIIAVMMTVWKDSVMLAFMMLGVAGMVRYARLPSFFWLIVTFASFWMAAALRHNALVALIPLLFCMLYNTPRVTKCWWCMIAKTLVLVGFVAISVQWINSRNVTSISMFPTVGVWDLAVMSVDTGEMLIPPYALADPSMTAFDVEEYVDPIANVPLCRYVQGKGRVVYCMEKIPYRAGAALASEQIGPLTQHWISSILKHPVAYLSHRLHVTRHLLGMDTPHSVPFVTHTSNIGMLQGTWYNGPSAQTLGIGYFATPSAEGQKLVQKLVKLWHDTPLMSPWPYMVLLAVMTLIYPFIMPATPQRFVGYSVLFSGWFMALPLLIIVPNFQLRYLIWPIVAALLSIVLIKRPPKRTKKLKDLPDRMASEVGAGR